jgi:hypothetical protein
MLPGRKLAHLEGRRLAGLNIYEWWIYLTAKADWDYAPSRRNRWKIAWHYNWWGTREYTFGKPFK